MCFSAGMDYNVTASVFNVTITAGAISSSFNTDIIDDVTHEDNETFNIAIRLLPSCLSLSLGTSSSTISIVDNDGMYVTNHTIVHQMFRLLFAMFLSMYVCVCAKLCVYLP